MCKVSCRRLTYAFPFERKSCIKHIAAHLSSFLCLTRDLLQRNAREMIDHRPLLGMQKKRSSRENERWMSFRVTCIKIWKDTNPGRISEIYNFDSLFGTLSLGGDFHNRKNKQMSWVNGRSRFWGFSCDDASSFYGIPWNLWFDCNCISGTEHVDRLPQRVWDYWSPKPCSQSRFVFIAYNFRVMHVWSL